MQAVGGWVPDAGRGRGRVLSYSIECKELEITLWVGRARAVLLLSRGCVLGSLSAVRHGCDGSEVQNGW